MNIRNPHRNLYLIAYALTGLSLLITARTLTSLPQRLAQVARRHGDVLQLQGLAERNAVNESAVKAFAETGDGVTDLSGWLREKWPGWSIDVQERETVPLRPGWSAHRVDVRLADATLADAGRLWTSLEALRPPWRVVECQVTASEPIPGRGRMTLVVETVKRTESKSTL